MKHFHRTAALTLLVTLTVCLAFRTTAANATRPNFDADPHPPPPDYALTAAWAGLAQRFGAAGRARADVFYVHPTTYATREHWNQDIADTVTNSKTDHDVLARQASIFSACCRIYAPRYRQAATGSIESTDGSGEKAFALAYEDVKRAFLYYLAHFNRGRPFILVGHSQGSRHLNQLIAELIDHQMLQRRFIAAYTPGVSLAIGEFGTTYKTVALCRAPTSLHCIASWNSFEAGGNTQPYRARNAQHFGSRFDAAGLTLACVNPISFDLQIPAAAAAENQGALLGPAAAHGLPTLLPKSFGARCVDGVLMVDGTHNRALTLTVLPNGMLHYHDFDFFYENIRANALARVAAYFSGRY